MSEKEKVNVFEDAESLRRRHFNYFPVDRTESAESIKVTYKPRQTFIEKWQRASDESEENENEDGAGAVRQSDSPSRILKNLKLKSMRLLNRGTGKGDRKLKPSENVQHPDVGLNDLQL